MKTRKNRRKNRRKFQYKRKKDSIKNKKGGGNELDTMTKENNILNDVNNSHKINIMNNGIELGKKMTSNLIQNISQKLNIDLTNPDEMNDYLKKINIALNDPKNKEQLKEIIRNASEHAKDILEASSPFIEPLINKTIEESEKAMSKIGSSAVKIGLNTAEEIPGVGILIGTIRSLNNAGEALLATINAGNEIITSGSDAINATSINLKNMQEEKNEQ